MENNTQPVTPEELDEIKQNIYQIASDTQPLVEKPSPIDVAFAKLAEDERLEEEANRRQEDAQVAWNKLVNNPLVQAMKIAAQKPPHEHGPFTWLLNANHNALRGCTVCGATWVGVMAGTEDSIRWHEVQEPPEEEEESSTP